MDNASAESMKDKLNQSLGTALELAQDAFFYCLRAEPSVLPELMQALRDEYGFDYLANLTSIDYNDEFEMVYHLYSFSDQNKKLAVKARVSRSQAQIPSVCDIYPTADWQEREVFDLMGIDFNGHPNLKRILLPDDFEGHPLRKDFGKLAPKKHQ